MSPNQAPPPVPLSEVGDLMVVGEPLPFKVLDAQGRLLLAAGQRVANARQLEALLERGACVEYPEVEAVRRARAAAAGGGTAAVVPATRRQTLFDQWERLTWELDAALRLLARESGAPVSFDALVAGQIAMVDREPDAALFIGMRQDDKRFALYGLTHAIHTATLVLLGSRQLGWAAEAQRTMMAAALTMNASIVELQGRMAEQSDPPTKKQIETIRAHPHRSAAMLRTAGVADAEWLTAVEDHHERAGEGGYPRGVPVSADATRLLRAADVFMAKISPRALRAPMLPQLAARQLYQEEGGSAIAGALIKAVGVHPPGDFVRLRNGEAAIVVQRAAAGRAAQVVALLDGRNKPVPGAPRRDTGQGDFGITGALTERAGLPRVLPEQVYGLIEPVAA